MGLDGVFLNDNLGIIGAIVIFSTILAISDQFIGIIKS